MSLFTISSPNTIGLTKSSSWNVRDAIFLLLIFAGGLAARELFVVLSEDRISSDEIEYHSLASSLVNDGVYAIDGRPTAYRPVGYPLFVASIYQIAGAVPEGVRVVQAFLDALVGVLLYLLATRSGSRKSGFLAAGIWMLSLPAVFYANRIFSETLFTFLLVVVAYLGTSTDTPTRLRLLMMGVLFAFLTLIKPWMILFAAFWYAFSVRTHGRARDTTLSVVLFVLLLSPWVIRNTIEFGVPALSLNTGLNLYIGHNPESTGGYKGVFPEELLSSSQNEVALDRKARAMALTYVMEHPEHALVNGIKKIAHLFASEGELLVFTFSERDSSAPRRYFEYYADLPIPLIVATNAPYFLILLTGMAGLVILRRESLWYFTAGMILTTVFVAVVFFGGSRFHFPLMPFLTIFAAWSMTRGISPWRGITRFQWAVIAALTISFCSIWVYEIVVLASV